MNVTDAIYKCVYIALCPVCVFLPSWFNTRYERFDAFSDSVGDDHSGCFDIRFRAVGLVYLQSLEPRGRSGPESG